MHFVLFYHSLVSDWNHGNAHFLRGVASELLYLGNRVTVLEPAKGWSRDHLVKEQGAAALDAFHVAYPALRSVTYDAASPRLEQLLDELLDDADVVLVHEWTDPRLSKLVGEHRQRTGGYRLFFHDTHHRLVSEPEAMDKFDLSGYDGVLAFGEILRDMYQRMSIAPAWTWHEAADTRKFHPLNSQADRDFDLVWVGNWGDGERARELMEFLVEPVRDLRLRARVHGVRYPKPALQALHAAGIEYSGWIANFDVPWLFARARATVHVPRRFYREQLPGIPTIRMFEALACGIPLVSAPWSDSEQLFRKDIDYFLVNDQAELKERLRQILNEPALARELAQNGVETILARHTCGHRVRELQGIVNDMNGESKPVDGVRKPSTNSPSPRQVTI